MSELKAKELLNLSLMEHDENIYKTVTRTEDRSLNFFPCVHFLQIGISLLPYVFCWLFFTQTNDVYMAIQILFI